MVKREEKQRYYDEGSESDEEVKSKIKEIGLAT